LAARLGYVAMRDADYLGSRVTLLARDGATASSG
jgi:hypothetical protein